MAIAQRDVHALDPAWKDGSSSKAFLNLDLLANLERPSTVEHFSLAVRLSLPEVDFDLAHGFPLRGVFQVTHLAASASAEIDLNDVAGAGDHARPKPPRLGHKRKDKP